MLEILLEISIGSAMGAFGVWDGSVLMGCMVVNAIMTLFLQRKTSIIILELVPLGCARGIPQLAPRADEPAGVDSRFLDNTCHLPHSINGTSHTSCCSRKPHRCLWP